MSAPATFLLIRHGACGGLGERLNGRTPGVLLDDVGVGQVTALAEALRPVRIAAVCASPLERTRQTADAIAEVQGLGTRTENAFLEVDFGEWTGASFHELEGSPGWREFNMFRAGTPARGGESLLEVQSRAVAGMLRLRDEHPDGTIAIVTHGDVIRAVLCHWLGMRLDAMLRLEIAPASVSALRLGDDFVQVLGVNLGVEGLTALAV